MENIKKKWETPKIIIFGNSTIHTGSTCGTSEGYTTGRPPTVGTQAPGYFLTPGGNCKYIGTDPTNSWGTDATNSGVCGVVAVLCVS